MAKKTAKETVLPEVFKVGSMVDPHHEGERLTIFRLGIPKSMGGEGVSWEVRRGGRVTRDVVTLHTFWTLERLDRLEAIDWKWTASGREWRRGVQKMRAERAA